MSTPQEIRKWERERKNQQIRRLVIALEADPSLRERLGLIMSPQGTPNTYPISVDTVARHLTREAVVVRQAIERGDKEKAGSALEACRQYLMGLQNIVDGMPQPPNVRPGYTYDSVRPPN